MIAQELAARREEPARDGAAGRGGDSAAHADLEVRGADQAGEEVEGEAERSHSLTPGTAGIFSRSSLMLALEDIDPAIEFFALGRGQRH